ncbi:hypothetical protein [Streptosporangium sp. NPDC049376]|uniref:hypothetical protein n=1 Tax=Streptosporangium sp. NPDC049376 TaxID=3366192 RepID=UPI0037BAA261
MRLGDLDVVPIGLGMSHGYTDSGTGEAESIEDVVGAVAELVEQGKVREFGLSEGGLDTIRRTG